MYKAINFRFLVFTAALAVCFSFASCGEDAFVDEAQFGYDYYPVQLGSSWTYKMDSIVYDNLGQTIESSTSYIKETIKDFTVDAAGDSIYVLEISKRSSFAFDWVITDNYTISKNNKVVRRVEENLAFIKLVFPTTIGKEWQGNQFDQLNTEVLVAGDAIEMYKNWDYRILNQGNGNFDGMSLSNVLEVQQANDSNIVELRYSKEYYAENIGMINREVKILDITCSDDCDEELPWEEKAHNGFILNQTLIEYEQ